MASTCFMKYCTTQSYNHITNHVLPSIPFPSTLHSFSFFVIPPSFLCLLLQSHLYLDSADYVIFGSLSINIPFGARVGNISCTTITLIADTKVEEEQETFSLKLSPGSLVLVSDKTATVTIMDADSKGMYVWGQMIYCNSLSSTKITRDTYPHTMPRAR